MSEQLQEGLGARFAAARIKKNLSLDDVADQLKLAVSYIKAIEEDNYEPLPVPVFVRGYLKNYAALVELPEAEVIAQYEIQQPVTNYKLTPKDTIKQQVSIADFPLKMITYLLAALMLVLLIVWWLGRSDDSGWVEPGETAEVLGEEAPQVEPVEPQLAVSGEENFVEQEKPVASDSDKESIPENVPVDEVLVENAATTSVSESQSESLEPADITVGDESSVEEIPGTVTEPKKAIIAEPEKKITKESAANDDVIGDTVNLTLNFSSDCWVEVRQKDGKGLFVDLGRKGYEANLVGQAPIRVLLGNSSVATVSVNNKPIDFAPFTQKLIARFVVMPDGSLQSDR